MTSLVNPFNTLLMLGCSLPLQIQNFSKFGQCLSHQAKCYFQLHWLPCFASSAQTGNHPVWEDSVRSPKSTHTQVQDLQGSKAMFQLITTHCLRSEQAVTASPTHIYIYCFVYVYMCMHVYACKYMRGGPKRYFTNPTLLTM